MYVVLIRYPARRQFGFVNHPLTDLVRQIFVPQRLGHPVPPCKPVSQIARTRSVTLPSVRLFTFPLENRGLSITPSDLHAYRGSRASSVRTECNRRDVRKGGRRGFEGVPGYRGLLGAVVRPLPGARSRAREARCRVCRTLPACQGQLG